jgi:ammonia channel protein AmtB
LDGLGSTVCHLKNRETIIFLFILQVLIFLGGSETAINSRAGNAVVVSNLAAASGGLTWMFVEMIKNRKRQLSLKGNLKVNFQR